MLDIAIALAICSTMAILITPWSGETKQFKKLDKYAAQNPLVYLEDIKNENHGMLALEAPPSSNALAIEYKPFSNEEEERPILKETGDEPPSSDQLQEDSSQDASQQQVFHLRRPQPSRSAQYRQASFDEPLATSTALAPSTGYSNSRQLALTRPNQYASQPLGYNFLLHFFKNQVFSSLFGRLLNLSSNTNQIRQQRLLNR